MFSDGVSRLWILTTPRGSLDVDGYKDELGAIHHLIRRLLVRSVDSAISEKILATVQEALKHMDEQEKNGPDSEGGS